MATNEKRGLAICTLYREGLSVAEIVKELDVARDLVYKYLKNYYFNLFGENYESCRNRKSKMLGDLYKRYLEVYKPGIFTRESICKILECNTETLEAMLRKYKVNNQWLKTYYKQRTLCNVSEQLYIRVGELAKKYGYRSKRDYAMDAIAWFSMMLESKDDSN